MISSKAGVESLEAMEALSDEEVVSQTKSLIQLSRTLSASVLMHVGEMEARGLDRTEVYRHGASLEAWARAEYDPDSFDRVARVVRTFPKAREMLERCEVDPLSLAALSEVLTESNSAPLLERARGCSVEELERWLDMNGDDELPAHSGSPERYRMEFMVGKHLYEKLQVAASLLSEEGDEVTMEEVVSLALETLFDSAAIETRR